MKWICELLKRSRVSGINLYIEQSITDPSRFEIRVWIRNRWLIYHVSVMQLQFGILISWTASPVLGTAPPNPPTRVSILSTSLSVSLCMSFVFTSSVELVGSAENGKEKGFNWQTIGTRPGAEKKKDRERVSHCRLFRRRLAMTSNRDLTIVFERFFSWISFLVLFFFSRRIFRFPSDFS